MTLCAGCRRSIEDKYTFLPYQKMDSYAVLAKDDKGRDILVPNLCDDCKHLRKSGRNIWIGQKRERQHAR